MNLLDELIAMFDTKHQDCIGDFEKFSECSRECGYGRQEKVYRITQDKGENGIDCPYSDGHKVRTPCILRDCNLDEECRHNHECRSRYCDPGTSKCARTETCDRGFKLIHCYEEDECLSLNNKYDTEGYTWDDVNGVCSYDFKPRTEYRFFGKPEMPKNEEAPTEYDYFWITGGQGSLNCNSVCRNLFTGLTCDEDRMTLIGKVDGGIKIEDIPSLSGECNDNYIISDENHSSMAHIDISTGKKECISYSEEPNDPLCTRSSYNSQTHSKRVCICKGKE